MNKIVVFDGLCNLCNQMIKLLLLLDRKNILLFTSLQGEKAKSMNIYQSRLPEEEQSILYIKSDPERIYYRSDAIIEVFIDLFWWGKVFLLLRIIPKLFRDYLYRFIAKNRFNLFGRRSECRIPTKSEKERFLP